MFSYILAHYRDMLDRLKQYGRGNGSMARPQHPDNGAHCSHELLSFLRTTVS